MAIYEPDVQFLVEQLRSLVAQSVREWICIITADSPLAALRVDIRMRQFFEDGRFVWNENSARLGHLKNFGRAIALTTEWGVDAIATADQDDIWYPEKLEVLYRELKQHSPLALVHSDADLLIEGKKGTATLWQYEGRRIEKSSLSALLIANQVTGCTMMFDAELARRHPIIDPAFKFHDHWFAVMAASDGGVYPVGRTLMAYRQHEDNVVGATLFENSIGLPGVHGAREELYSARKRWLTLRARFRALKNSGETLSVSARLMFGSFPDFGLPILVYGLVNWRRNPRHARYAIRAAIGKPLWFLRGVQRLSP